MKGRTKLGAAIVALGITLGLMPFGGIANAAPEDTNDSRTEWAIPADEGRTNPTAAALWIVAPIKYDSETGDSAAFPDGVTLDIALGEGHELNTDEGFVVFTESDTAFPAEQYTLTDLGSNTYRFEFQPLAAGERFKVQFITDLTDNTRLDFNVQTFPAIPSASLETGVLILSRAEAGEDPDIEPDPRRFVYVGVFIYIDTNANGTYDEGEQPYTGGTTTLISGTPEVAPLITDETGSAQSPSWEYQAGDENRILTFTAPDGYTVATQLTFTTALSPLASPSIIGAIYNIPIRPVEAPVEPEPETPEEPEVPPVEEPEPAPPVEAEPEPEQPTEQPPVLAYTGGTDSAAVGYMKATAPGIVIFGLVLIYYSIRPRLIGVRDAAS